MPVPAQASLFQEPGLILDVRTPEETAKGVLAGAMLVPLHDLSRSLEAIRARAPGKTPVYVYCRTGNRSGTAVEQLKRQGFNAFNVGGVEVAPLAAFYAQNKVIPASANPVVLTPETARAKLRRLANPAPNPTLPAQPRPVGPARWAGT